MSDKIDPYMMETMDREFKELCKRETPLVILELSPLDTFILLGSLQLALRHPAYSQERHPSAVVTRRFADQFVEALSVTPALAMLARMGFNPDYDVDEEP